ncbi:MAG: response regulator transcription factor [Deltaproteobacteria bacterium]|nr:response regulator transcription factor [Deltaproteobacteria bacterium]
MKPSRVVVADDHVLFRQGMKKLLEDMPGVEVIGEAGDGLELLNLLKELDPDIVLVDISMPNVRGIEAAHEIRSLYPQIKVLILTMHRSKEYLYHAISAGAHGYLLKEDSDIELFSAIETIRDGRIYVSQSLAGEMADNLSRLIQGNVKDMGDCLSNRETEVIKLISEGKTNIEIGELLSISPRTVETHRAHILEKLKLKRTADIVRYAIEKGIA